MGLLLDLLVILGSQGLFFVSGWLFFVRKLSGTYKVSGGPVLGLFAATFSLSCTLFELIIFEIVDILQSR